MQQMTRRAIWRASLIPQFIATVFLSLIVFFAADVLATKAVVFGGLVVMFGSFVAGFIGMGPAFNRVGFAYARVMIAEGLRIFVMLFLLVVLTTQTALPIWATCLGFGVALLSSVFSLKLLT